MLPDHRALDPVGHLRQYTSSDLASYIAARLLASKVLCRLEAGLADTVGGLRRCEALKHQLIYES